MVEAALSAAFPGMIEDRARPLGRCIQSFSPCSQFFMNPGQPIPSPEDSQRIAQI
jgi:hypothetical protein